MTDLEILQRLVPGWGKATKPCDKCEGSGGSEPPIAGYDKGVCTVCDGTGEQFREWLPCPDCEGATWEIDDCDCNNGRVPDAEGREIIAEAVKEFNWLCGDYFPKHYFQSWMNRDKPIADVCDSLESHVISYQRPAPDLKANDGRELKAALRAAGIHYAIQWYPATQKRSGVFEARINPNVPWSMADTEADALYAATEAALGGE